MTLLATLLFSFSFQASALICIHPSAGLQLEVITHGDRVELNFSSARGYSSIPQIEGPVSESDLPMMRFQWETLRELGDGFQVSFPQSACDLSRFEKGIFACYHEGEIKGTKLAYSSLTAFRSTQSHVSGDHETQHFRMIIGDDNRFFFSLPFPATYCQ